MVRPARSSAAAPTSSVTSRPSAIEPSARRVLGPRHARRRRAGHALVGLEPQAQRRAGHELVARAQRDGLARAPGVHSISASAVAVEGARAEHAAGRRGERGAPRRRPAARARARRRGSRPVVTQGLAGGKRNAGWRGHAVPRRDRAEPDRPADLQQGRRRRPPGRSRAAAAPSAAAAATRSSSHPATAVSTMPCQRGAPSHAATSPASAMFAQSSTPTASRRVTTGKSDARSSRPAPTGAAGARPGGPATMSGTSVRASPSQSPSRPARGDSAAGTASSATGVSQTARTRETEVIRAGRRGQRIGRATGSRRALASTGASTPPYHQSTREAGQADGRRLVRQRAEEEEPGEQQRTAGRRRSSGVLTGRIIAGVVT